MLAALVMMLAGKCLSDDIRDGSSTAVMGSMNLTEIEFTYQDLSRRAAKVKREKARPM